MPRHDRNALRERRSHLGIAAIDRTGNDHHIGAAEMFGRMADENLRTEALEPLGDGVGFEIGALDLVAQVHQHFCNAAHAAAADADQVNGGNAAHAIIHAAAEGLAQGVAHAGPPAAAHRFATWSAASVTRAPRAAVAILRRRSRSAVRSTMQALKVSAVRSRSCSTSPAPMCTMVSAFLVW